LFPTFKMRVALALVQSSSATGFSMSAVLWTISIIDCQAASSGGSDIVGVVVGRMQVAIAGEGESSDAETIRTTHDRTTAEPDGSSCDNKRLILNLWAERPHIVHELLGRDISTGTGRFADVCRAFWWC